MRILLIEDEPGITRVMRRALEQADFDVDSADNGNDGLEMARDGRYSLIILDLMLPGIDGWRICSALRESRDRTPILMVTARDMVGDRIKGLDLGADDYLPKPFDIGEMLARVRALIRRDKIHKTRVIKVADLTIDTAQHRACRAGLDIPLSHREYQLLEALAAHEGQVLSRDVILERIWMDDDSLSNTVDVYINMLRKKIDAAFECKLIQTVRGVGYSLRAPDQLAGA